MALSTFAPSGQTQFATATFGPTFTSFSGISYNQPLSVATAIALPAGSAPSSVLIENLGPETAMLTIAGAAAVTTATASAGSLTITVASATGILVGQVVVNGGALSPGTAVAAISGTTVTLTQPLLLALSSTTLSFITAVTAASGIACVPGSPLALSYVSSGFVCAICQNYGNHSILSVSVGS